MSREVYRVPLDFRWPHRKVWKGFRRSEENEALRCDPCEGMGSSDRYRELERSFYDNENHGVTWWYDYGVDPQGNPAENPPWRVIGTTTRWMYDLTQDEVDAIIQSKRLSRYGIYQFTPSNPPDEQYVRTDRPWPTAAQVNHDMLYDTMGHDGVNTHAAIKARMARLYPGESHLCPHCGGEGIHFRDDAHRAAYDAWEMEAPPEGEGWQMWETTTEGSPISPVLPTPEKLAAWLYDNDATSFGSQTPTYAGWLGMIRCGHAPSMVAVDGVVSSGVDHVAASEARLKPIITLRPTKVPDVIAYEAIFDALVQDTEQYNPKDFAEWCRDNGMACKADFLAGGAVSISGEVNATQATAFKLRWL
ncbi:MAG: hypothetical protein EOP83_10010 [Verrucomicrobiaceae bacterium]|nr:MAG: hypothetical protein EOP83_10010 [Verrucomicrobiaceae bacterium]